MSREAVLQRIKDIYKKHNIVESQVFLRLMSEDDLIVLESCVLEALKNGWIPKERGVKSG